MYRSGDRTSGQARYEYIISSGSKGCWHMRRLGGSTLSPSGTLFSRLPLSPSLCPPVSLSLCRPFPEARRRCFALIIHALTNPPPMRPDLSPSL